MSILRMASFKASYALFLKLLSGAIRTIAMFASAMFGNALVGFRSDTTILLQWESSFTGIFTGKFLAYHMPECQAGYFLRRYRARSDLTSWLLAYQMPSLAIFDPSWRSNQGLSPLRSARWNRARRWQVSRAAASRALCEARIEGQGRSSCPIPKTSSARSLTRSRPTNAPA